MVELSWCLTFCSKPRSSGNQSDLRNNDARARLRSQDPCPALDCSDLSIPFPRNFQKGQHSTGHSVPAPVLCYFKYTPAAGERGAVTAGWRYLTGN